MPAENIMSGRDVASGGLITRRRQFAAKKWADGRPLAAAVATGHSRPKMVGISV
jgi:hypothetical protein